MAFPFQVFSGFLDASQSRANVTVIRMAHCRGCGRMKIAITGTVKSSSGLCKGLGKTCLDALGMQTPQNLEPVLADVQKSPNYSIRPWASTEQTWEQEAEDLGAEYTCPKSSSRLCFRVQSQVLLPQPSPGT